MKLSVSRTATRNTTRTYYSYRKSRSTRHILLYYTPLRKAFLLLGCAFSLFPESSKSAGDRGSLLVSAERGYYTRSAGRMRAASALYGLCACRAQRGWLRCGVRVRGAGYGLTAHYRQRCPGAAGRGAGGGRCGPRALRAYGVYILSLSQPASRIHRVLAK